MFFQNGIIMMPAVSPVLEDFFRLAEDPYLAPRSAFLPLSGSSEANIFSGLMLTALAFKHLDRIETLGLLRSNGNLVSIGAQKSWHDNNKSGTKFGNIDISNSVPSYTHRDGWNSQTHSILHI